MSKRVRMLTSMAGHDFSYDVGEEYDLADSVAEAFCSLPAGEPRAEPVGWELPVPRQTATRERRETAAAGKVSRR